MKKNNEINFWKFIFALIILLFHSCLLVEGKDSMFFPNGAIGVEFFFIVSGYLTARTVIYGNYSTPYSMMIHKIKSFILPVWCSWLFAFITLIIVNKYSFYKIVKDTFDSIYELLFLKNFGFDGVYTNGVTWYISALLISVALISVPLYHNKKEYIYIWAPLIAFFLLGFLSHQFQSIRNTQKWLSFVYKCQLRAVAEVNLGIFIFGLKEKTEDIHLTKIGKLIISFLEMICYITAILYMQFSGISGRDFGIIIILAIAVLLSFSGKTYLYDFFDKFPVFSDFCGKFSLYIYLNQVVWYKALPILMPNAQYNQLLILYVLASFGTATFMMVVVRFLKIKGIPKLRSILFV